MLFGGFGVCVREGVSADHRLKRVDSALTAVGSAVASMVSHFVFG